MKVRAAEERRGKRRRDAMAAVLGLFEGVQSAALRVQLPGAESRVEARGIVEVL